MMPAAHRHPEIPAGPLAGVRVVELAQDTAGPYTGKLLAGLGAEVIKVEPPSGDVSRRTPDGSNASERAPAFLYLNTGKKSAVLDLETAAGQERLRALLDGADVLIESDGPGVLERHGLAPAVLRQRYPRLIVLRLSDFGQDGPYCGYRGEDIVLQALGGLLHLTGEPDAPPLKMGGRQSYMQAGLHGFVAVTAALTGRERTGQGCVIDLSVLECVASILETATYRYASLGQVAGRDGNWANRAAWGIYPCADGHVAVVSGDGLMFRKMGRLIPELDDRRYDSYEQRRQFVDEINSQLLPWLMARTKDDVYHLGQAERLPFGSVRTVADLVESPHLQARGFFEPLPHPVAGVQRYPRAPFILSRAPWHSAPAPLLGAHGGAGGPIAAWGAEKAGPACTPAPQSETAGAGEDASPLPLAGVRVLDLTMVWAGPFATKFLADLGADVIKIESLHHVDSRLWAGFVYAGADPEHPPYGRDAYVVLFGRNKRGITLDLATPEGKDLFFRLVAISDVVVENFASGVMDRLGLDVAALQAVNPALIVAGMPGFGNSGPDRHQVAYGTTLESLAGLAGITGYHEDEPHKSGINYGDPVAGLHTAGAVMAALYRTRRTGDGESIEVAQLESLIMMLGDAVVEHSLTGAVRRPFGNRDRLMAPQGVYPCLPRETGAAEWIAICIADDAEWRRLVDAMGCPAWAAAPELAMAAGRRRQHDAIDLALSAWTAGQQARPLMERLQAAGVRAGVVQDVALVLADPHVVARGLFSSVVHPDGNRYPIAHSPWRWDGQREPIRCPAPALGQDNEAVLRDVLGLDAETFRHLEQRRLIGRMPVLGG